MPHSRSPTRRTLHDHGPHGIHASDQRAVPEDRRIGRHARAAALIQDQGAAQGGGVELEDARLERAALRLGGQLRKLAQPELQAAAALGFLDELRAQPGVLRPQVARFAGGAPEPAESVRKTLDRRQGAQPGALDGLDGKRRGQARAAGPAGRQQHEDQGNHQVSGEGSEARLCAL